MQFSVVPHVGVGPVLLGMTRQDVHRVMPVQSKRFRKALECEHETDSFYVGFHVYYRGQVPTVEYIELCSGCCFRAMYGGMDVFATPADGVVARVSEDGAFDVHDPELGYSYIFPSLDLSLWRPTLPIDSNDLDGRYFSTIGVGIKDYYR